MCPVVSKPHIHVCNVRVSVCVWVITSFTLGLEDRFNLLAEFG